MRHTVWTLLFALLLQLLAGSAWAWRGAQATEHSAHCHNTAVQAASGTDTHHTAGKALSGSSQPDSHHCCAVCIGAAMQPLLPPLPQAAPTSRHGPWASLSLRPDLRPPI